MPAGFNNPFSIFSSIDALFNVLAAGGTVAFDQQYAVKCGAAGVAFAQGTGANQAQYQWQSSLTFVASTPQTLDFTALTGGVGQTNFAAIKGVIGSWTGTAALTISGGASNPWLGPMGTTFVLPAASGFAWPNPTAGGWVVDGTHKSIKFDPSTGTGVLTLVFIGI